MDARYGTPTRLSSYQSSMRETGSVRNNESTKPLASYTSSNTNPDVESYTRYPSTRPFINNDYRRSATKPLKSYPESNRSAIMTALKGLQGKIQQLELERSQAEDNLKCLASETTKYRDILTREQDTHHATQTVVSQHSQELESQLKSAETRCNLLEKQLDYMRTMVQTAERDRSNTIQHQGAQANLKSQIDKISDLEREHLKLTASQNLAENKIRELEEKLKEERHHRKSIQEKSAELETAAQANRILTRPPQDFHKTKKKKRVPSSKINPPKVKPHRYSEPHDHYRLNLGEIPFVTCKSASPSHNVNVNVQKVLSMLKNHSPRLCAAAKSGYTTNGYWSSSGSEEDLLELLTQLQDEFAQMSFEHQDLSEQVLEATDHHVRDDLERELDTLVTRMEIKGDQISRLKRHQNQLNNKKQKKKMAKARSLPNTARSYMHDDHGNGEVQVTTTVKTKGRNAGPIQVQPGAIGKASLNVLKDMKRIQTSLRKDDLAWE